MALEKSYQLSDERPMARQPVSVEDRRIILITRALTRFVLRTVSKFLHERVGVRFSELAGIDIVLSDIVMSH
jgi:hypothetical protein